MGVATFRMDATTGITPKITVDPDQPTRDLEALNNYGITAVTLSDRSNYGTDTMPLSEPSTSSVDAPVRVSSASFLELRGSAVQWPTDTLEAGKAYQINAKVTTRYNDNGGISAAVATVDNINWVSSVPSVATVDRYGVIRPLKPGQVTIALSVKYAPKLNTQKTFTVTGTEVGENTVEPMPVTGDWEKVNGAVDKVVELAPTEERTSTSEGVTKNMVKLMQKVGKLSNLDDELKSNFKTIINQRAYSSSLNTDEERVASMQEAYTFATYMDECITDINAMSSLSRSEKEAAVNQLKKIFNNVWFDSSLDLPSLSEQLRSVVKEAELTSYNKQVQEKLTKDKAALKTEIESSALDADKKSELIAQLDKVTTPEELQGARGAFNEAQEALSDEAKLSSAKQEATAKIQQLDQLSEAQKKDYADQVNAATSVAGVENVLAEAQAKNQEIADQKAAALASLKNMTYLSPSEVARFQTRINAAQTAEAINAIKSEAESQNVQRKVETEELASYKKNAKSRISQLENLNDGEKSDFNSQVDVAASRAAIDEIYRNAESQDAENKEKVDTAKALADAKSAAIQMLANLSSLSPEPGR